MAEASPRGTATIRAIKVTNNVPLISGQIPIRKASLSVDPNGLQAVSVRNSVIETWAKKCKPSLIRT